MAAAPPTSSSPTTLMTAGIQQPHPLKGIANSNDDPHHCARCSVFMQDLGKVTLRNCCGRAVCGSCDDIEEELNHCPQCNSSFGRTSKEFVVCLKKHSKKGHPWAQVNLAGLYCVGNGIRKSLSEASHWNRQAAKRGHPLAMRVLGGWFLHGGFGCPIDLQQAQEYYEAALEASKTSSAVCYEACQEGLVEIAECHCEAESFKKAKAMLLPLAEEGVGTAQEALGDAIIRDYEGAPCQNPLTSALFWFSSAAFALMDEEATLGNAEIGAMVCCEGLHKYAQAKFWGRIVKKTLRNINIEARIRVTGLVNLQRELRSLRDVCGGCGAEFEGKERKFCHACRAYCYCSRECQKMHWNRKEGGHREDCKGASELKQKMKEKKKAEAIKASESK